VSVAAVDRDVAVGLMRNRYRLSRHTNKT
jgi:hypothetical protein